MSDPKDPKKGDAPASPAPPGGILLPTLVEEDMEKATVDFVPNYDERLEEPTVLPSKFPNLICNGGVGIAVGMATSIPPHNLAEVVDAIVYLIANPACAVPDLMKFIPGPDFP